MSLSDLKTAGYTVIPGFLTSTELNILKKEFAVIKHAPNKNYSLKHSAIAKSLLGEKVMSLSKDVEKIANLKIDILMHTVLYTDTEHVNFGWHQDHESQYVFQQSLNHLNFYIPIIKPNPNKSGLSVIPMDLLEQQIGSEINNFIGSAAKKFFVHNDVTFVQDDETGKKYNIPVNIETIAVTPDLLPGDLLLIRGDVIHKTQDCDTRRVAISIRAIEDSTINRTKLFSGCDEKKQYIKNNHRYYDTIERIFESKNTENILASDIKIK